MRVTLGGQRLGSGNKADQEMHNYYRSTHNLSQRFTSSMTCGTLVPFLCIPTLRGDKFDIDLRAAARTRPTVSPLFGSFKMQIDIFHADMRLYQALLHNNPIELGLKTSQVMLPQILMEQGISANDGIKELKYNTSCLMSYLGFKGVGLHSEGGSSVSRMVNAIPVLAYYDIYKNYYANKQEENAYIVSGGQSSIVEEMSNVSAYSEVNAERIEYENGSITYDSSNDIYRCTYQFLVGETRKYPIQPTITIMLDNEAWTAEELKKNILLQINAVAFDAPEKTLKQQEEDGAITFVSIDSDMVIFRVNYNSTISQIVLRMQGTIMREELAVRSFKLKNIDDMRMAILSKHTLGNSFKIGYSLGDWKHTSGTDQTGLPYTALTNVREDDKSYNNYAMNGLALKTYQSDIYNNWLNTEWIDGENGIRAITAVSVTDNKFSIDALQLAEKLYNLLNRVAVSGGTWEDYLDAVYTQMPHRHIETPIYLGGMSNEVIFDEIVQTAPTEGAALGTLGGRGVLIKRKGGKVHAKIYEPGFLIGIVSITPRINYHQGNEFYMTDLKSIDDLHKPEFDQIGFQNLIGERLAWWDTKFDSDAIMTRSTIGKIPAWLEYMTAVDKSYGDFADEDGRAFMVLNRNYEEEDGEIKDATTYVDPTKFNYAFAYSAIDAQNFWVSIQSDIITRRLISAKQIPNI